MRCPHCCHDGSLYHPRIGTFCASCLRTLKTAPKKRRASARTRRLLKVAVRDRWTCWLCGLPVNPIEATRDHVVTASRGGTAAYTNLRLAHEDCNQTRADDLVRAQ